MRNKTLKLFQNSFKIILFCFTCNHSIIARQRNWQECASENMPTCCGLAYCANTIKRIELTLQLLFSSLQTEFAMLSTVDWAQDVCSEFQTAKYNSEAMTTSSEWTSATPNIWLPTKPAIAFIGYLGTVTNVLVLVGFWLSDRSKIKTSSILIINHTTLEQSTFS